MDTLHGVDVSFFHHTHKDHPQKPIPPLESVPWLANGSQQNAQDYPDTPDSGTDGKQSHPSHHPHLIPHPHLHPRHGSEKTVSQPQSSPKATKDNKAPASPSLSRKGSWISSLSSKFSSASQQSLHTASPTTSKSLAIPKVERPSAVGLSDSPQPQSASPDSGGPGFLRSALRRLSSSGTTSMGKVAGDGSVCPRRIMNVDPYRERCQIEDLQPAKLRRVSFCVDVEIATPSKYVEEEQPPSPPPTPGRRPSLTQLEKVVQAKKTREKNVKTKEKPEVQAPKLSEAVATKKEAAGGILATDETAANTGGDTGKSLPGEGASGEVKDTSRKKEKKKRSEEERKERKERKRQLAVANGTIPLELLRDEDESSGAPSTGTSTPSRSQGRPTTDPLRIYRRCCQLRETGVLKEIADQLLLPNACDPTTPSIVSCLDLSDHMMQLPDIITLGDFLAVVPVKKLLLENCGLTDEALRVILAGVLAAKTPDQAKHNKHLPRKVLGGPPEKFERLGVIEKLSLKNNSGIGRDGWNHIGFFINMSRSLKAIDLSMIPFPSSFTGSRSPSPAKQPPEVSAVFARCMATRLAGSRLEEIVMAECSLSTESVRKIVDAVIACGATRLGLANNNLTTEAVETVAHYVRTGKCQGLDLGGNDLSQNLGFITSALNDPTNPMYALSLADCKLSPTELKSICPVLIRLPNFRFIDLSHNRRLFDRQPNALTLLRKYLPQMRALKRIHLNDVAMEAEHCIALAEICPEIPGLAHLSVLDNPSLTALATARDETSQEEACALYASLMAAVRVSKSIVSIDIDVPTADSSEVVKALAKQVVAYSLRNMERGYAAEVGASTADIAGSGAEKLVAVPDILLHLVGHVDGFPEDHDDDEPAPDEDYIVGGQGVVKALGVVLGNRERKRLSKDITPANSGTTTPRRVLSGAGGVNKGQAKEMSKNLLASARKIRTRLQPALAREADVGSDSYRRLQFLDSTLQRMIQRFEDEYPECRIAPTPAEDENLSETVSEAGSIPSARSANPFTGESSVDPATIDIADEDSLRAVRVPISRHNSDVSIASRTLVNEEGRLHRFGHQFRREMMPLHQADNYWGTDGSDREGRHLAELRARLEEMDGNEIKERVENLGAERVLAEYGATAKELRMLDAQDPECFNKLIKARSLADKNGGEPVATGGQAFTAADE